MNSKIAEVRLFVEGKYIASMSTRKHLKLKTSSLEVTCVPS